MQACYQRKMQLGSALYFLGEFSYICLCRKVHVHALRCLRRLDKILLQSHELCLTSAVDFRGIRSNMERKVCTVTYFPQISQCRSHKS